MARILLVEDDIPILETVARFLRVGYEVITARSQSEALGGAQRSPPDLVVLEVKLEGGPEPDRSGFDVCHVLRSAGFDGPVIFLTASSADEDRRRAFDLGADDYLTKPFALPELEARIAAAFRRRDGTTVFRFAAVEVDLGDRVVRHADREERLSRRASEVLRYLIDHRGRVVPRGELLLRLWREPRRPTDRAVDAHVRHLRRKLRDDAARPALIETVRGVGYRFIGKAR